MKHDGFHSISRFPLSRGNPSQPPHTLQTARANPGSGTLRYNTTSCDGVHLEFTSSAQPGCYRGVKKKRESAHRITCRCHTKSMEFTGYIGSGFQVISGSIPMPSRRPPFGVIGNATHNFFHGGLDRTDLVLHKWSQLGGSESRRLDLRLEAFNVSTTPSSTIRTGALAMAPLQGERSGGFYRLVLRGWRSLPRRFFRCRVKCWRKRSTAPLFA